MKTALVFLLLLTSVALGADKQSTAEYRSLVERAKNGDVTVDFRRLRLAYSDSSDYENAPDTDAQKKGMVTALQSKDFKTAIENADAVLASDFADMDAHFVEYVSYRELHEADKANLHRLIFQGLLRSITDSGDGKSPETAFQVIEVHEEYVLLRSLGVGLPKQQSLIKRGGHSYDKITFEDPESKTEKTIYFNVDIPMKHGV